MLQEPHVHEPEYISKGRFEKFMTDRKEGRLKDPQTSIMLIAFKKSLSGFEKVKLLTLFFLSGLVRHFKFHGCFDLSSVTCCMISYRMTLNKQ